MREPAQRLVHTSQTRSRKSHRLAVAGGPLRCIVNLRSELLKLLQELQGILGSSIADIRKRRASFACSVLVFRESD